MKKYKGFKNEFSTRLFELKSYFNAISGKDEGVTKKFIVFAQYRSGSTLLSSLLDSHPEVTCEREIFLPFIFLKFKKVLSPDLIIKSRLIRCENKNYGFILRLPQLKQILVKSSIKPEKYINKLHSDGWKFIHLRRNNPLKQSISNITQLIRGHSHDSDKNPLKRTVVRIEPQRLINTVKWMEETSSKEEKIFEDFDHIKIVYEKHLLHPQFHQETANRIFRFLDIEPVLVSAKLKRISSDNLGEYVENFNEIQEFIKNSEYSKYLNED